MTEHTPGPWEYDGKLESWHRVRGPEGSWRIDGYDHVCNAFTEANARLIAAAPDMLEVLEAIENDAGQVPDWLWDRIQQVVAKARGDA